MVKQTTPPANGFVRAMRKMYNPLGFSKGYNFVLWFLAVGYIMGFVLARLMYLSFSGIFCNPQLKGGNTALPGECYWYSMDPFKIGIKLHLYCILPAAFLVCFQFVPAIRHKVILFHRLNGYTIIVLSLIGSAGAIIIAPHAFGGNFETQTWVGTTVILTKIGYITAWINIRCLQVDQHRAWMMRTWAWFSTIITIRIIMIIATKIISPSRNWFETRECAQINFMLGRKGTLAYYPACLAYYDGSNPHQRVIVTADFDSANPVELAVGAAVPFGTAGWLALVLHTIAIELYLRLTPRETERLRQVSYERQLAKGWKRPGYTGLVAERFGDADVYAPQSEGVKLAPVTQARSLRDVPLDEGAA